MSGVPQSRACASPNGVVWSVNVVDASNAATLATLTNFEVDYSGVFIRAGLKMALVP